MHSSEHSIQIKKEGDDNDNERGGKSNKEEWKCLDCKKSYKSYPAFYTHNKLKHDGKPPQHYDIPRSLEDIRKDRGRPRVTDSSQRIKFTMQDKHQQKCEDNIYEFVGKLGQKGDENGQRDNTVIRGYLKKPIDPAQYYPLEQLLNDPYLKDHAQNIKQQLVLLTEELNKSDEWEFVDPLELKPDDMSEFSIYNLKSLFFNLRERNMVTSYTTLVVFLVWISKELLDSAYKEISIITINYCVQYWEKIVPLIQVNDGTQTQEEKNFNIRKQRQQLKENFLESLDKTYNKYNFTLFEDKADIKSFLEKFIMWYYHFDDSDSMDQVDQQFQIKENADSANAEEDDEEDEENEEKQISKSVHQHYQDTTHSQQVAQQPQRSDEVIFDNSSNNQNLQSQPIVKQQAPEPQTQQQHFIQQQLHQQQQTLPQQQQLLQTSPQQQQHQRQQQPVPIPQSQQLHQQPSQQQQQQIPQQQQQILQQQLQQPQQQQQFSQLSDIQQLQQQIQLNQQRVPQQQQQFINIQQQNYQPQQQQQQQQFQPQNFQNLPPQ